jgi:integrase
MEVLKGRHERATEGATLAGVALSPDSYIFSADPDGARPMIPDTLTQAFERLCRRVEQPALERLRRTNPKAKRADLPPEDQWSFRLHDLRHYTATQLFADGMNPKTVADRLGHADASVTLRVYTANTNAQAQAAADSLEAGLGVAALPL